MGRSHTRLLLENKVFQFINSCIIQYVLIYYSYPKSCQCRCLRPNTYHSRTRLSLQVHCIKGKTNFFSHFKFLFEYKSLSTNRNRCIIEENVDTMTTMCQANKIGMNCQKINSRQLWIVPRTMYCFRIIN